MGQSGDEKLKVARTAVTIGIRSTVRYAIPVEANSLRVDNDVVADYIEQAHRT